MNKTQRIILIAATIIIVLMVLFPPVINKYSKNTHYEFLFGIKTYEKTVDGKVVDKKKSVYSKFSDIENEQLLMQIVIILIINGLLVLAFKERE